MKKAKFYLCWYDKKGDDLIGDECLEGTTKEQIRKWFCLPEDDEEFACLIVQASHVQCFKDIVKHRIDLNDFDYFIEHVVNVQFCVFQTLLSVP